MKINIKHLIMGIILNILVIIASIMIYHAYVVKPSISSDVNYNADIEILDQAEGGEIQ